MKTTKTMFVLAAGALMMPVFAQEVVREPVPPAPPAAPPEAVTTARPLHAFGTITKFGDNSLAIQTEASRDAIPYRFSTHTQWVDEAGKTVARETIRTGAPVTVYYTNATDGLMVSKVVVRKEPGAVAVEHPAPTTLEGAAATTTTVQPAEVAGTVVQFSDGALALRTEGAVAPVQYRFTKTTQWVDEAGNVVRRESIPAGAPVMLYYSKAPNGLLISKAVVRRVVPAAVAVESAPAASTETVVTTTVKPMEAVGTITEFGDGVMVLRSENSATPVQYKFSDTTQWLDKNGRVVARETVRTGVPVTLVYTKGESGLIVSKVVVQRAAPAVQVEERNTIVEERPAPKVVPRKKPVVKRAPAPKVIEKEPVIVEERPKSRVIETQEPVRPPVIQERTTTTTTTKKADDDDDDD